MQAHSENILNSSSATLKRLKGPKINPGCNPATWMLEVSSLEEDFADIYLQSSLCQKNKALIEELKKPDPNSEDLHFETKFSQPFWIQVKACLWRQNWSYWRNPQYNSVRFLFTHVCTTLWKHILEHGQQDVSLLKIKIHVTGHLNVSTFSCSYIYDWM